MKKTLIIFSIIFLLLSCWVNNDISNEWKNDFNNSTRTSTSTLNNTWIINGKSQENNEIKIYYNLGSQEKKEKIILSDFIDFWEIDLPSPVHSFKWDTPIWTEKIEIIWEGENGTIKYFLENFKELDESFLLKLWLNDWNIWYWINVYTLNFYKWNHIINDWVFIINTFYEEINIWDYTIYFDESFAYKFDKNTDWWNIYINKYNNSTGNILIKKWNDYVTSSDKLIYNKEKQLFLEIKNVRKWDWYYSEWDLFIYKWDIFMIGFAFSSGETLPGWGNPVDFNYNPEKKELKFKWWYWDGWWYSSYEKIYDVSLQKYKLEIDNSFHYISVKYLNKKIKISVDFDIIKGNKDNKLGEQYKVLWLKLRQYVDNKLSNEYFLIEENTTQYSVTGWLGDNEYDLDYENKKIIIDSSISTIKGGEKFKNIKLEIDLENLFEVIEK